MNNTNLRQPQQIFKPAFNVVEFTKNFRKNYPVAKQATEDFIHQQKELEVFGKVFSK